MIGRDTALVVVNYGSHGLLEQNLVPSVEGHDPLVVVVDSFSSARERADVGRVTAAHGWELVGPDTNVGFGGGVNLGVARARELGASTFVFLNPDARLEDGALDALVETVAQSPTSLVAPVIYRPDGTVWSRGLTYVSLDDGTMRSSAARPSTGPRGERAWLSGACLAVGADLWDRTGGFDEEYFLYWEDVDLSARVEEAGGTLRVLTDVRAVHDEGATHREADTGTRAKSSVYYYYNIRNRMLYATKHLGAHGVRRWRRTSPLAARAIILQGGRKQLVRSVAPWRAGWRGLRDGWRLGRGR